MMNNEAYTTQVAGWPVRIREPQGPGPHPILLLIHGWTGDENSMWIFASRLPSHYLLLAPRGMHASPLGGYSWDPAQERRFSSIEDLHPAVEALVDWLTPENFPSADTSQLRLAGFSQGAAVVYSLALLHPKRVISLAGLAGFLPQEVDSLIQQRPLAGKPVFIAHGTKDERVPVERARSAAQILEQAGAQVTYCEDDVGHKLSLPCFKGLEAFFAKH